MATARQACAIIEDVLQVPSGTARFAANFLREAGAIASSQGRPTQIETADLARILLSVVLGAPCSRDTPGIVADYFAMLPSAGGRTFGDVLAGFLDDPNPLLELRIDALAPGATATYRGGDNGVATANFYSSTSHPRPAFRREVIVAPDIFIRLSAAIRAAPAVRTGRRRAGRRFATQ